MTTMQTEKFEQAETAMDEAAKASADKAAKDKRKRSLRPWNA